MGERLAGLATCGGGRDLDLHLHLHGRTCEGWTMYYIVY